MSKQFACQALFTIKLECLYGRYLNLNVWLPVQVWGYNENVTVLCFFG